MHSKKESHDRCLKYFNERVYGIEKYFQQGYLTISAFSVLDLLRYIHANDSSFLFSPELLQLSKNMGLCLPASEADITNWSSYYLEINKVMEDIKKSYTQYRSRSQVFPLGGLNKKTG